MYYQGVQKVCSYGDDALYSVYKENEAGLDFYRVLISHKKLQDISKHIIKERNYSQKDYETLRSDEYTIVQVLLLRTKDSLCLLDKCAWGLWLKDKGSGLWTIAYEDFFIKPFSKKVGIIRLSANAPIENGITKDNLVHVRYACVDNAPYASQSLEYSFIDAKLYSASDVELPFDSTRFRVFIKVSDFFLDAMCPLRYSFLSALDNKAETFFRDNSQANEIHLVLDFRLDRDFKEAYGAFQASRLAFINGNGTSQAEYDKNNRIAGVSVKALSSFESQEVTSEDELTSSETAEFAETCSAPLLDACLEMQTAYISLGRGKTFIEINTSGIYETEAKNSPHACISEFDIYTTSGWLFGWQ